LIVEQGWTHTAAAKMFMVSPRTAGTWAGRYRGEGPAGMVDRSSRPRSMPTKTTPAVVRRIVGLRWRQRLGPLQIGGRLGLPASTVHAVLVRCRINRLHRIDRVTGEPLRRYEHDHPGSMIHVDGHLVRKHPRRRGLALRRQGPGATATRPPPSPAPALRAARRRGPLPGTAYVHTVIDDHCRVAYAEIHADEKATTAAGVLRNANASFAQRGVLVERVLSDNGSAYKSHLWADTCAELGITPKKTRPNRPQANGKIERLRRTLGDGWVYAGFYDSENRPPSSPARVAALLQPPPTPQRHRSPTPDHPPDQPAWTSQLAGYHRGRRGAGSGGGHPPTTRGVPGLRAVVVYEARAGSRRP
jgi:transposase InsO family protein